MIAVDGNQSVGRSLNYWAKKFKRVALGKHWELFAADRNAPAAPAVAPALGVHGVRRPALLEAIRTALDRVDQMLEAQGRNPWPDTAPKVRVCVFGIDDPGAGPGYPLSLQVFSPASTAEGKLSLKLGAVIALPGRSAEPLWERELAQAVSATVHEWSHCMNLQSLPLRRDPRLRSVDASDENRRSDLIKSWHWLDEGMAVATEASFERAEQERRIQGDATALVSGGDWLRFALDWVDRPERSLDDPRHRYQSAFFVRYLERLTGGPQFLNEVWQRSSAVWVDASSADASALAALARHLQQWNRVRAFCAPREFDVFASGYCFDSYFLNDPASLAYEPLVHARFGDRAVTAFLRRGVMASPPIALPGLACRYFRLLPPDRPGKLVVRLTPGTGTAGAHFQHLKAELGLVRRGNPHCCRRQVDNSPWRLRLRGDGELRGELPGFSDAEWDHAVLVVTNCNWSIPGAALPHPAGYPHESQFTVEARFV